MKRFLRTIDTMLQAFGLDLRKTVRSLRGLPRFLRTRSEFRRESRSAPAVFPFGDPRPILGEELANSGQASGHYFHQDLLVARRIRREGPALHVDVGSRIDGFVAHVASFRELEVFDIRPMSADIPNVMFVQVDLMAPLPPQFVDYCDSLSCLHALEHFGLGRYGDPVDHDGHLRGLDNLHRILTPGGALYLSVPIGPQRVEFNAHRVFSVAYLLDLIGERFRVGRFSFVDDVGALHEDVGLPAPEVAADFGCSYGCGIFELTKV